eukprot:GHVQ01014731.1.p1 GENE.GHVQ01014731.1~~GHVQ01014731.1.p1  ORF type:complete len:327 (+),score=32.23 GHVQ01014731.1:227-1207(+)
MDTCWVLPAPTEGITIEPCFGDCNVLIDGTNVLMKFLPRRKEGSLPEWTHLCGVDLKLSVNGGMPRNWHWQCQVYLTVRYLSQYYNGSFPGATVGYKVLKVSKHNLTEARYFPLPTVKSDLSKSTCVQLCVHLHNFVLSFPTVYNLPSWSELAAKLPHDTTIKCFDTPDNGKLTCSSHLLAATSEVFKAAFSSGFKDSTLREFEMPDCRHAVMDNFLQFIQTNSCPMLKGPFVVKDVVGLLRLGHKYDLKKLTQLVTHTIRASGEVWKKDPDAWALILDAADKTECDDLKEIVVDALETVTVSQLLRKKPQTGILFLEDNERTCKV